MDDEPAILRISTKLFLLVICVMITLTTFSTVLSLSGYIHSATVEEAYEETNSLDAFPEEKTRLVVRATQIEGLEHGFAFCEDGTTGPVIEGDKTSISDWEKVDINCTGDKGFLHTHPVHEDSSLSFSDKITGDYRANWQINCVASSSGHVNCLVNTDEGKKLWKTKLDVGENYTGDPSTLNEKQENH